MTTVHRSAATGFAKEAETYRRGRPDYPAAIDAWLTGPLGLGAGCRVVDLGAGTGKFSLRLIATGAQVTAVEPVAEMRAQFALAVPDATVVEGTAEAIPLPSGSVDVVACAQSFHWFATPAALAEIHRVLRPGGSLALVWNVRDETVDWVAAISAILQPHEGDTPRFHKGDWKRLFPAEGFGPLDETVFPHGHQGPVEQVIVDRSLSVSFIAVLPDDQRNDVAAALRRLATTHPALAGKSEVEFPYRTQAYSCRRL